MVRLVTLNSLAQDVTNSRKIEEWIDAKVHAATAETDLLLRGILIGIRLQLARSYPDTSMVLRFGKGGQHHHRDVSALAVWDDEMEAINACLRGDIKTLKKLTRSSA
jgi:hypothetical protein